MYATEEKEGKPECRCKASRCFWYLEVPVAAADCVICCLAECGALDVVAVLHPIISRTSGLTAPVLNLAAAAAASLWEAAAREAACSVHLKQ